MYNVVENYLFLLPYYKILQLLSKSSYHIISISIVHPYRCQIPIHSLPLNLQHLSLFNPNSLL